MNLKEINDQLIEISGHLDEASVNPINSHAQKRKFISAYNKGEEYNPQFKYDIPSINFDKLQKKVESIQTDHELLKPVRDYMLKKIRFSKLVGTNNLNYTGLYGKPKKRMVEKAKKLISRKKSKKQERPFSATATKGELKVCFKKYGITNWKVAISNNIVAKADTIENKKILKIKKRNYSFDEIKRLEVHEVETHILRAVNGSKQKYTLLGGLGTPGYLTTEEGLAIIMEEMNNVLSEQTLRFYCARIIAVDMALKKSFYNIFKVMHEKYKLSKNNAFVITKRAKRGLLDTSLPGGYIKDHIYFEGRELLKRFIKKGGDIELLFAGKISIDDIPLIEKGIIKKPEILPYILR